MTSIGKQRCYEPSATADVPEANSRAGQLAFAAMIALQAQHLI